MLIKAKQLIVTSLMTVWVLTAHGQQKMYFHKEPKQDKEDQEVFNVTKNTELAFAGIHTYCQLQYINGAEVVADIKKNGELKMLSKEDIEKQIEDFGNAGMFMITIKRTTIEAARLDWFTIVVQDKTGAELFRGKPEGRGIPKYSGSPAPHYYNIGSVRVDETFKEEVKVFVVDELKGIRHEYLIRPL